MDFELKDVLDVGGPSASLVFAALIYLGFLQQRYSGAYARYRDLVDGYRQTSKQCRSEGETMRRDIVASQIRLYKRRCEQLRFATNAGVIAAILLVLSLITGLLQLTLFPAEVLKAVCLGGLLLGLVMLTLSAAVVIVENSLLQRALDSEIVDLPELTRPDDRVAAGDAPSAGPSPAKP